MADIAVVIESTSNIGWAIEEGLSADGHHIAATSHHGHEPWPSPMRSPQAGPGSRST